MKKHVTTILMIISLSFDICAVAQTQIGLTLNLGYGLKFSPSSYGFKNAICPSGSIFLRRQWDLSKNLVVQAGATFGSVGYKLKVVRIDTLGPQGDIFPFSDYSTLFLSSDIVAGWRLIVGEKELTISAGGGITAYASMIPINLYNVDIGYPNGTLKAVFDGRVTAPFNTFSPFLKFCIEYNLSEKLAIGSQLIYHTKAAANGTYNFYHSETPHFGTIEIFQQEIRLVVSYDLPANFRVPNLRRKTRHSRVETYLNDCARNSFFSRPKSCIR